MKIGIIGMGLIGSSFALALKEKKVVSEVIAIDLDVANAKKSLDLGIADRVTTLEDAATLVEGIIISTPINYIVENTKKCLDIIPENVWIFDVGSTKQSICEKLRYDKKRENFIALHPLSGTENSGPENAFSNIFENKICIACEKELSNPLLLEKVINLCERVGFNMIFMNPKEHDKHIAYVSHLSHITSFALGASVMKLEKDEKNIFNLASTGFESTVRLAKSSPDMWTPIFLDNKKHISNAIKIYIDELNTLLGYIEKDNKENLNEYMKTVNKIRPVLDGINKNNK